MALWVAMNVSHNHSHLSDLFSLREKDPSVYSSPTPKNAYAQDDEGGAVKRDVEGVIPYKQGIGLAHNTIGKGLVRGRPMNAPTKINGRAVGREHAPPAFKIVIVYDQKK